MALTRDLVKGRTCLSASKDLVQGNMKAHGAGTLVRDNNSQSEVNKKLVLDISVCTGRFDLYTSSKYNKFELRDEQKCKG